MRIIMYWWWNDETLWWDSSLVNCFSKQFGRRKLGKFTVQPIMNNTKVTNSPNKVWLIFLICQIRHSKVPPSFCLYSIIIKITAVRKINYSKLDKPIKAPPMLVCMEIQFSGLSQGKWCTWFHFVSVLASQQASWLSLYTYVSALIRHIFTIKCIH